MNIRNKSKINIVYIVIGIAIILIPNLPYKIPVKIKDSNLIELELILDQSTGGPYVNSGSESLKEYASQNGYSKIDSGEINLTNDNIIEKNLRRNVQGGDGPIKYKKVRVYGEIIGEPDRFRVLTFDIKEWNPIGKYVAIKDTNIWVEQYRQFYFTFIGFSALLVIIINIFNKKKNSYN